MKEKNTNSVLCLAGNLFFKANDDILALTYSRKKYCVHEIDICMDCLCVHEVCALCRTHNLSRRVCGLHFTAMVDQVGEIKSIQFVNATQKRII